MVRYSILILNNLTTLLCSAATASESYVHEFDYKAVLEKTCVFHAGITNFDLLGNYGKIRWLGNYFLIFAVNFLFAAAAALCLFNKVGHSVQMM